eukprot:4348184-Prymnesium_polylepis.1
MGVCWSPLTACLGQGGALCAARALLQGHLSPPSPAARLVTRPRRLCRARRRARSLAAEVLDRSPPPPCA